MEAGRKGSPPHGRREPPAAPVDSQIEAQASLVDGRIMLRKVLFTVPGIPPSVNHYIQHTRSGHHYKTDEAKAFEAKVALAAGALRGRKVEAETVEILVVLGPKRKGDVDNFAKVVLDSMVRCGVIRSDASVIKLIVRKTRAPVSFTNIQIEWESKDA